AKKMKTRPGNFIAGAFALVTAGAAVPLGLCALGPIAANAQGGTQEITITISSVRAVDSPDLFSKADYFARVTIDGDVQSTQPIKGQNEIRPNWKIVKRVAPGRHTIKVEILDKDLARNDLIDINAIDKKRDLDFTLDSRNCRIEGFATTYRCGTSITRTGN